MNKITTFLKKETDKMFSLIAACIIYCSLCINGILATYSIESWLIFICLIYFCNNVKNYNRKYFKIVIIFSIIFSLLSTIGNIVYVYQNDNNINTWAVLISARTILHFLGDFCIIYYILINFIPFMCNLHIKINNEYKISKKKLFIFSFVIILLGWSVYFLALYPGCLTPDSFNTLEQVIGGFKNLSNHHPLLYQFCIYIPYFIGSKLFSNINEIVAFITFFQMLIMASIFSYSIVFIFERCKKLWVIIILICFFAFGPMHCLYSVTMWKDVIFAGCMLLLTIETIKILEKQDDLLFKDLIYFVIISIFTLFFRNNAIYMYIVFAIFSLLLFNKIWKKFLLIFIIVFGFFIVVKGPIFSYFNVADSSSSEYIAIPLQQIGRMAFKNVNFNESETELLNKLIPVDVMKNSYCPDSVDCIKFNKEYHRDVFDNNKIEYFKLWFQLIIKHPDIAIESYLTSTVGYWYPGVDFWATYQDVDENNLGIYKNQKGPNLFSTYVMHSESRKAPILNSQWSIGFIIWIIIIFSVITVKRKGMKYIYPYIPIYGIWLTMLVASPLYCSYRYVYSAYTCLPIFILIGFINIKVKKEVKKI